MGYLSGSGELEIVWKGVEKWVRATPAMICKLRPLKPICRPNIKK
jgi:hypothetical protein